MDVSSTTPATPETPNSDQPHQTATDPITDPLTNPYTSLNNYCHDLTTLQDLATRGQWKTILDKVTHARSQSHLTKPHEHLIYLTFQILALLKLRRFTDASNELDNNLENDLDSPFYTYQNYRSIYPTHPGGSMVPFSLRFLHAHLPSALNLRNTTLDRLYSLLDFVRTQLEKPCSDISKKLWEKREKFVINTLISHHLSQKEFKASLTLFGQLIGKEEDPVLMSKMAYVQMQYGDIEGAKATFNLVEEMLKGNEENVGLKNLVGRNKALVYLVGKDYVSAVREYDECIERDGMDVVAVNNKALCLMYLRDLSDSIKVLENALERVPTAALNETVIVNLCSMYELAYVNHADIKRTLSSWIARVAPDDFDTSCTRI